jgi:hypothetical protein
MNPFSEYSPNLVLADLGGKGERNRGWLAPDARVVKAFNSIIMERFNEGFGKNGGRRVIFVSGDDPESAAIKQLVHGFDGSHRPRRSCGRAAGWQAEVLSPVTPC